MYIRIVQYELKKKRRQYLKYGKNADILSAKEGLFIAREPIGFSNKSTMRRS
jgi:hypothetical protein